MVDVFFGEQTTRLDRSAVKFFQDTAGADVRPRLQGWPPSRDPRGTSWRVYRLQRAVGEVAEFAFDVVSGGGEPDTRGQQPDPELERRRLVVLVGDPGQTATTVPFQLDERLRVPGTTVRASARGSLLTIDVAVPGEPPSRWEAPVARAEVRRYGGSYPGLKVHFADGSWVRLDSAGGKGLAELGRALNGQGPSVGPQRP